MKYEIDFYEAIVKSNSMFPPLHNILVEKVGGSRQAAGLSSLSKMRMADQVSLAGLSRTVFLAKIAAQRREGRRSGEGDFF